MGKSSEGSTTRDVAANIGTAVASMRARIRTMCRPVRRIIAPISPLYAAHGDDDVMSQEPGP
jgi:hypothetical protein